MASFLSKAAPKYRCFQPISVLTVVEGQPAKIQSVGVGNLRHDWLSVLSLMGTLQNLQGELGCSNTLGCCHRFTLEVPVQEGPRSLATDKMSNHVIAILALIGLIMSTSYFQNRR